jgi:DNA adenine methylase
LRAIKEEVNGDDEAHKNLFDRYQSDIETLEPLEQAVGFFVMNKCSYSGLTENSTFSVQASRSNFSLVGIDKLPKYSYIIKDWKITNIDYAEVMNVSGEEVFVFLDPPYDIKDFLYGTGRKLHSSFSHERFADDVDKCPHRFMITYNLNDWLLSRYKEYNLNEWKLRYSMVHRGEKGTQDNVKTELLITNYTLDSVV